MQHLNLRQCALETAIGDLNTAGRAFAAAGDDHTAIKLFQLAEDTKRLRHPAVVDFLERRRLRRALQAGASA